MIGNIKDEIFDISYLKREGLFDTIPESSDNLSDKRRKAMESITFNNDKDVIIRT